MYAVYITLSVWLTHAVLWDAEIDERRTVISSFIGFQLMKEDESSG